MHSTRRGIIGGLALFAITPALARSGGGSPFIVPPEEIVFPTEYPTLALTSGGMELTELGRQSLRFMPVAGREGRYCARGAVFHFRRVMPLADIGAAIFARNGRFIAPVHVAMLGDCRHYTFVSGDSITITELQSPSEIVLSL